MASAVLPARLPVVRHGLRQAHSLSPVPSTPLQSARRMRPAPVRPVSAIASFQDFAGRSSSSSSSKSEEEQSEQQKREFLRGGEDVADIMTQMAALLEDIQGFEEREEALAVEMAAAAAIAGRLEVLDRSFLLALDYMLQEAGRQKDSQQVWLLGLLKKQVLLQLESKFPPQVEVLSMLVTTPKKETRLDILRRSVAAASLGANRAQLEAQVAAQENSTEKSEGQSTVGSGAGSSIRRSLGDKGASSSSSSTSIQGVEDSSSFPDAPIPVSERSGPQALQRPSTSGPEESAEQRRLQSAGAAPGRPSLRRGSGGGRGEREREDREGEEEEDEEENAARGPAAVWEEYAPEEAWDLDRGSEDGSEGENEGERKRRKVKRRVPAAPLQHIVAQADDIVAFMEENLPIRDRRLLARLVLAREEARGMMSGGFMDPRNDVRGLQNLPEAEVRFISALAAIRPDKELRARIMEVMKGEAEGEYKPQGEKGQPSVGMPWGAPVRPGQFIDSVTKVIVGVYTTGGSGVVVQQLERIRVVTLEVFQHIGFS